MLLCAAPLTGFTAIDWPEMDSGSIFSVPAKAATIVASGNCGAEGDGSNLTWTMDSNCKIIVRGNGRMKNYAAEGSPWYNNNAIKTVVIQNGVTGIGENAFRGCAGLDSVTIGNSVTSIGGCAFAYCAGLPSVTIPDSVTSIGEFAFYGCKVLASVTIGNGVKSIGNSAFSSCQVLTSVTIPASVTKIGNSAFSGCVMLTSVTIPASVKSIGNGAFYGCSKLAYVYYTGTKTQWNAISIGSDNDPLNKAAKHYILSYTVNYHANGGTGTPSAQTKTQGTALTLSSIKPTKAYTVSYNANGGSVSPASKTVSCTFKNWNTAQDGGGAGYAPGASYTKDANVTLYAQWTNPKAGSLATPTRGGYTFDGWYTAATGGTRITADSTITANTTLYAHWKQASTDNIYNLGEETYGFENYRDTDSPVGHCFGMSITSSAYYLNLLDISKIGLDSSQELNRAKPTTTVKAPICYYQGEQGPEREEATVAGGSWYLYNKYDPDGDWKAVVNYVKNHLYDNKGSLQVGIRNEDGGHAINFLRYENVNGQDRIYVYDNNFPDRETYLYKNTSGTISQVPVSTFENPIKCIALRDVKIFMHKAQFFDATHAIYVAEGQIAIDGLTYSYMEGTIGGQEYVMYTIPAEQKTVTITPLVDNADFIYLDTEYSFGKIDDETYGVFKLATMNEGAITSEASLTIYNKSNKNIGDVDGNGKVESADARLALRTSVKLEPEIVAGTAAYTAADVNKDGIVGSDDARTILRVSVKLETFQ